MQHRFDWNAREGQILNIAIPMPAPHAAKPIEIPNRCNATLLSFNKSEIENLAFIEYEITTFYWLINQPFEIEPEIVSLIRLILQ